MIIPSRTHHQKDIIEAIAPVNLRKSLGKQEGKELADGCRIQVEVMLQ
ncbi:MAG: DUF120 domain-containing protein [Asgard group archaeon]|nr:DUF120 domain-containing protein [Asgard group archaeon]